MRVNEILIFAEGFLYIETVNCELQERKAVGFEEAQQKALA